MKTKIQDTVNDWKLCDHPNYDNGKAHEISACVLKNWQCIQILIVLYLNQIVLFFPFSFFYKHIYLSHNFRSKQCIGTMSYQLSVESITHYTAKEALAFFQRDSEVESSSLSSSFSSEEWQRSNSSFAENSKGETHISF